MPSELCSPCLSVASRCFLCTSIKPFETCTSIQNCLGMGKRAHCSIAQERASSNRQQSSRYRSSLGCDQQPLSREFQWRCSELNSLQGVKKLRGLKHT